MTRVRIAHVALTAAKVVVCVLVGVLPAAGQTARARYEAAQELDAEARALVARTPPSAATPTIDVAVRAGRRAVTRYESVVRQFPKSGYSDNALLSGADLSRLLFATYERAQDRRTALDHYAWLIREYPASGLVREARVAARAIAATRNAAARPVPQPRATPASAPAAPASAPPVAPRTPMPATVGPARTTERAAPSEPSLAVLRQIERAVLADVVRVTLQLDREVSFSHEMLAAPTRAFLDLHGVVPSLGLQDVAIRYDDEAIRQVRVGRQRSATRVVLDLDGAPRVSIFTLYNPFRVVIDTERASAIARPAVPVASAPAPAPAPAVATLAPGLSGLAQMPHPDPAAPVAPLQTEPSIVATVAAATAPRADEIVASRPSGGRRPPLVAEAPPADVPLAATFVPAPDLPAANVDGTFSLARQLGLGVSRIVIDPGHGGYDPGTLAGSATEAAIVLDVALRLEKLLAKEPGLEVVLTRRTDVFIPLEQRTAIANREGADLFVSIHANASRNPKARGIETYYLSFASNPEAEAVAARENATSARDMHSLPSIVRAIALNNKLDESRDLAGMVQDALVTRLARANSGLRSRGVKKAPFVVLIGAQMPSVLAEIAFLTNRQEVSLVKTPVYRQRVAESLHAAILRYRRALKRQGAVAAR